MTKTPRASLGSPLKWGCATAALILGAIALAGASQADTSYLKPNFFTTADGDIVTIQSSFTEDFANPNVAVQSDAWSVVKPDGTMAKFGRIESFKQVTILESEIKDRGTYRFTTGERLGRLGTQVLENGEWKPWAPGREIPAGAKTRASQTATVADVYVTRGAPTMQPVEARVGTLELKPQSHPNDVLVKKAFKLKVLLGGKPVPNQDVIVWRDGGAYDEPAFKKSIKSAADGSVSFTFDKPGVYLIWTRMSGDAPAGAQTAIRSYTTSLTLEVAPA